MGGVGSRSDGRADRCRPCTRAPGRAHLSSRSSPDASAERNRRVIRVSHNDLVAKVFEAAGDPLTLVDASRRILAFGRQPNISATRGRPSECAGCGPDRPTVLFYVSTRPGLRFAQEKRMARFWREPGAAVPGMSVRARPHRGDRSRCRRRPVRSRRRRPRDDPASPARRECSSDRRGDVDCVAITENEWPPGARHIDHVLPMRSEPLHICPDLACFGNTRSDGVALLAAGDVEVECGATRTQGDPPSLTSSKTLESMRLHAAPLSRSAFCRAGRLSSSSTGETRGCAIYDGVRPGICDRLSGAIISGPYDRFFGLDPAEEASMLGVHFEPGGR